MVRFFGSRVSLLCVMKRQVSFRYVTWSDFFFMQTKVSESNYYGSNFLNSWLCFPLGFGWEISMGWLPWQAYKVI